MLAILRLTATVVSAVFIFQAAANDLPRPIPRETLEAQNQPHKPHQYSPEQLSQLATQENILELFAPWLGMGKYYINRSGVWRYTASNNRANSYAGLRKEGHVSCYIASWGRSGFVRFGQLKNIRKKGDMAVLERTQPWKDADDISPNEQALYESYCPLFNDLVPYWLKLGYLEY